MRKAAKSSFLMIQKVQDWKEARFAASFAAGETPAYPDLTAI
jgi:hypothetical protein